MNKLTCLAVGFSCLLSGAAVAGDSASHPHKQPGTTGNSAHEHDAQRSGDMILDHERREDERRPGVGTGAGNDGTDSRTQGSGTDSDSVPNNIPPARDY